MVLNDRIVYKEQQLAQVVMLNINYLIKAFYELSFCIGMLISYCIS